MIALRSPWLVDSVSWRASRAGNRYAGHNELNYRNEPPSGNPVLQETGNDFTN